MNYFKPAEGPDAEPTRETPTSRTDMIDGSISCEMTLTDQGWIIGPITRVGHAPTSDDQTLVADACGGVPTTELLDAISSAHAHGPGATIRLVVNDTGSGEGA